MVLFSRLGKTAACKVKLDDSLACIKLGIASCIVERDTSVLLTAFVHCIYFIIFIITEYLLHRIALGHCGLEFFL